MERGDGGEVVGEAVAGLEHEVLVVAGEHDEAEDGALVDLGEDGEAEGVAPQREERLDGVDDEEVGDAEELHGLGRVGAGAGSGLKGSDVARSCRSWVGVRPVRD
jgi:hypothetical protein